MRKRQKLLLDTPDASEVSDASNNTGRDSEAKDEEPTTTSTESEKEEPVKVKTSKKGKSKTKVKETIMDVKGKSKMKVKKTKSNTHTKETKNTRAKKMKDTQAKATETKAIQASSGSSKQLTKGGVSIRPNDGQESDAESDADSILSPITNRCATSHKKRQVLSKSDNEDNIGSQHQETQMDSQYGFFDLYSLTNLNLINPIHLVP
ncbi:hypothetical protein OG21DRAFT_1487856 [Imleria badia]|nr:hypothetical protein OG21DRAFT_1487856 [Imleria badia]